MLLLLQHSHKSLQKGRTKKTLLCCSPTLHTFSQFSKKFHIQISIIALILRIHHSRFSASVTPRTIPEHSNIISYHITFYLLFISIIIRYLQDSDTFFLLHKVQVSSVQGKRRTFLKVIRELTKILRCRPPTKRLELPQSFPL